MPQIKILDSLTTNQIAAGEVIENPASVVKELIENSVDAGAKNIKLEIEEGGINLIRVSDDGIGINPDEVETAFKRHATSKIVSFDDLEHIYTLGFRGEALASIVAVSKVEIFTRTRNNISGITLQLEGGEVKERFEKGGPFGTVIKVEDLFFNVPARKKHLKSPVREATNIGAIVNRIVLANPDIKVTYINNGNLILTSPGNNNLLDAIATLFGNNFASKMLYFKSSMENYDIEGYVGTPELTRGNRSGQYFFVNARHIHCKVLQKALENAFYTLLPRYRFPVAVIKIRVKPALIDVNVHPAKREVKWVEPEKIGRFLTKTLINVLKTPKSIPGLKKKATEKKDKFLESTGDEEKYYEGTLKFKSLLPLIAETPENTIEEIEEDEKNSYSHVLKNQDNNEVSIETTQEEKDDKRFPDLIPITQIDATYILAKSPEEKGFFILDQHAAHERIIYDSLLERVKDKKPVSQYLVSPIPVELSPAEMSKIVNYITFLNDLGFCIEIFGDNTYLIRAVPQNLRNLNPEQLFYDLLSAEISHIDKEKQYSHLLKTISCKGAIKAGDKMETEEIVRLLNELKTTKTPYTCPHGRPTIVHISEAELKKKFYR